MFTLELVISGYIGIQDALNAKYNITVDSNIVGSVSFRLGKRY